MLFRRISLALICMGVVLPTLTTAAELTETITIRLGHLYPATHFEHQGYLMLAEEAAKRSNGKIVIEVYPSSQLGSEREQMEQLKIGAIEMVSGGGAIQNYAPEAGVWSLPFLFRSPEHFAHVMDGPVGRELMRRVLESSNIRILAYLPVGYRMFFNTERPLTAFEDFGGVKIRVDDKPTSAKLWRTLGANPVPVPFNELYTALQTGVVDAAENPPVNIIGMKFYEVAKFVTTTRHELSTSALTVNETWWQGLPVEARAILEASIAAILPERRAAAWDADAEALRDLKERGVTISELKEPEEFRNAVLPMYQVFGEQTNTADLIKEIAATP